MAGLLDNLLSAGLNIEGVRRAQGALEATGKGAYDAAGQVALQGLEQTAFKPFTITSGIGGITTTPEGGFTTTLSPEQLALQQGLQSGAAGLLPQAVTRQGAPYETLSGQALQQAASQLGGVSAYDPSMAAQRTAVGGLFGSQLGQYGMPTGLEGLSQQALTGGQQRIAGAGPSSELNQLAQLFGGNVSQLLQQQPSQQIGQLGSQALSLGQQGLGGAAPADIEALRAQYAGLAGQAAGGLLQPRGDREQEVYQRIRAAQSPEEERQRLSLENRLASQGRLGVSTEQFGGTPEQFALAKAQSEAQNQAALMAMQQAGTEEQQALQRALSLSGQTGQLAGTSSQLESAAQSRASELSQLGLSAEQIESRLQSEGLGRAGQAAGLSSQFRQASSGLESEALQRGLGLSQLGLAGTQAGAGLEAQRLQQLLGLQQADIGAAGAQQALQQGRLGLASGMFGLGQQAAAMPSQLQAGDISNLQALMQTSYAPEAQLLNQLQAGTNVASIADIGRRTGAGLFGEAQMSGIEAQLLAQQSSADLESRLFNALAQAATAKNTAGQGLFGQIYGGASDLFNPDTKFDWKDFLFG